MAEFDLVGFTKGKTVANLTASAHLGVVQAFRRMGSQLPQNIEALGRALETNRIPSGRVKQANLLIAEEARAQIVDGWRRRLPRRSAGYRPDSRLTGKLGGALENASAMVSGTTDRRISFINVTTLNTEATHWYRVNYGAEGENLSLGRHVQEFGVTLNGAAFMQLRDDTPPASQSWLPRNFRMLGPFPTGQLVLLKGAGPADVRGAGVRAARFTDIGLEVVARRLGDVYQEMVLAYAHDAAGAIKFKAAGIQVRNDLRQASFGVTGGGDVAGPAF